MHRFRICGPRGQIFFEQLRDVGAGNQRSLINVEAVLGEPGFLQEIGGGRLVMHTAVDEMHDSHKFVVRERSIEEHVEILKREFQRSADEKGCIF